MPARFAARGMAVVGYSAQAKAFFARLATQPAPLRKRKYDNLIRALVTSGVWANLDALYVFRAADQATALTNLVQSSFGAAVVGAPTFTADYGFTGAVGKYVNSTFNPTTAGGKYVQDSASIGGWVYKAGADNGILAGMITLTKTQLTSRFTGNNYFLDINMNSAGTGDSTGVALNGSGLWAASRTGANTIKGYRNGAGLVTGAGASAAVENDSISFLRGANGNPLIGSIGAGFIGSGLNDAQHLAIYNALTAYFIKDVTDFVFEGDSITQGSVITNGAFPGLYADATPTVSVLNNAVSGSKVADMTSRAAALNARLLIPAKRHVLVVMIGLNDFLASASTSTFLSNLTTYFDLMHAAGWDIVASTLTRQSPDAGYDAWLAVVNPAISAMVGTHGVIAVQDFAALGLDPATFVGGQHPTNTQNVTMEGATATTLAPYN